eukprot:TRINITY_DN2902_c0_g1_i10.p2 TRINITY_DN2902_c0_g1~~TRINITY_DN2902_c0_g1_i10.p2  ORF type:complete len:252 (-),score=29.35 TRINITY_DN2902_c0_g1_i10:816-1508(-)
MGQSQQKESVKPEVYVLKTEQVEIHILNVGCCIQKILMKDKDGKVADIVLGFDDVQQYLKEGPYFGAIIGRVANRIANAKFSLDGKEYKVSANDKPNSLHGGFKGFDKKIWTPKIIQDDKLEFVYFSSSGEEGYPGGLFARVVFELKNGNELHTSIDAGTDSPTIVNMTQHSYYNLRGHDSGAKILDQQLKIYAQEMTPLNEHQIPTGQIQKVAGSAFDFTKWRPIGRAF